MKLDQDLAARMRAFESGDVRSVPDDVFLVARVDGRSFTRLVREILEFEAPFDVRFRDGMVAMTRRLMECGFGVQYAYTQSDETSLLFRREDRAFGRKRRKLLSLLAGEASAAFTHALRTPAAFDCRLVELPTREDVLDYFRWRQEDGRRNALGGHCYWLLRGQGLGERETTRRLEGRSMDARRELLSEHGVDFDALPAWQRNGIGLYWETYERSGVNPKTGRVSVAHRRGIRVDETLPGGSEYRRFLEARLE